jgi:hypothetical protein
VSRNVSRASGRERDADHFRKVAFAIRLRDQQYAGIEVSVTNQGVLRITGRVQHLERRPAIQRLDGELPSVDQAGHDHVGEQEIDVFARIEDSEGFAGIGRGKRPVTEALHLGDDVFAHQNIVLDDQDRFIASFDTGLFRFFRRRPGQVCLGVCLGGCRGQINLDRRPAAGFAADFDIAIGLADQALDDAEVGEDPIFDGHPIAGDVDRDHDMVRGGKLAAGAGAILPSAGDDGERV